MDLRHNEPTTPLTQTTARGRILKNVGLTLAGLALAGFGMANLASAQTSEVCDPTGDPAFNTGKGGPKVPAWLDIVHSEITDAGSDIHFTLTLADSIPAAPAWKLLADGGQMWWGWRFVNELATTPVIKDGCVKAAGQEILAGYFVDLIWEVTSASFRARLLDDTTCVQNEVPFVFPMTARA